MTTINLTSAPKLLDFLKLIRDLRWKYKFSKHEFRVRTHLSYLRWPECFQLTLLSQEDKDKYSKEWLEFMEENRLTEKKDPKETFYIEEVDQMKRLVDYMNSKREDHRVYDDFRSYVKTLDQRRKTDFIDTFPEISYMMDDEYYG